MQGTHSRREFTSSNFDAQKTDKQILPEKIYKKWILSFELSEIARMIPTIPMIAPEHVRRTVNTVADYLENVGVTQPNQHTIWKEGGQPKGNMEGHHEAEWQGHLSLGWGDRCRDQVWPSEDNPETRQYKVDRWNDVLDKWEFGWSSETHVDRSKRGMQ
jgi:hypothetical protein